MKTETYLIGGMVCASCAASVENKTKKLTGVQSSSVNLTTEKMTITYDESTLSESEIIKTVEGLDFTISKEGESSEAKAASSASSAGKNNSKQATPLMLAVSCVLAAALLYISMGQMLFDNIPMPKLFSMAENPYNFAIIQMLLAGGVMVIGRARFVSGFKSLSHGAPNMDTLVAVSCTCAYIYSLVTTFSISSNAHAVHNLYFESCGVVLTFISLGKYMEARSKEKTKSAIEGLMSLAPLTALRVKGGKPVEIDASELEVGDVVLVLQGARVPADGVVIDGDSDIDESAFTGESMPVYKTEGSKVICGSVNLSKSLYVKVKKVGKDTTLAGIIKFVEDAQGKKAPIAGLADKVAGVFVPAVMGIATLSAVIWLIAGYEFSFALRVFTCVLVIACPCALGLATPTAIICGTGLGAQNGILIRSGEALETTKNVNVVVMDKTGTLTEGKPRVSDIFAVNGHSESEVLSISANIEQYSDHPLAKAVVAAAKEKSLSSDTAVDSFEYISGRGMKAKLSSGQDVLLGNTAMMTENSIDAASVDEFVKAKSLEGKSCMILAIDGCIIGALALSDTIKKDSIELISRLKEMNIKTVLLTGDSKAAAEYIGGQLGVDEIISEVLPTDKASVVEDLKKDGQKVMMVGDGVNDAPALSIADVGCAIGSGSDIAIDSADIVLMKDSPLDVARAINLSRLTIRNIKQNLFWAFFYNCIGIPVAAGVLYPINGMLLSPMIGGLAMSFSSVFVVSNALRLRTKKI